jgi:hypothetical protein
VHLDGYTPFLGRPKTKAALRVVGLDDATVALLASSRRQQTDELAALGAASSLAFAEADGSLIHLDARSAFTVAAIRTPPSHSKLAFL